MCFFQSHKTRKLDTREEAILKKVRNRLMGEIRQENRNEESWEKKGKQLVQAGWGI